MWYIVFCIITYRYTGDNSVVIDYEKGRKVSGIVSI